MGRLKKYLLQGPSEARDQYFLELHEQAEENARVKAETQDQKEKVFGAEDIARELKPLLARELSHFDCIPTKIKKMYDASNHLHNTLARSPLTATATEEERFAQGKYEQSFGTIQHVLINYLLGENYKPKPTLALQHWEVSRLTSVCERYKHNLCESDARFGKHNEKLEAIKDLLAILTDKEQHDADKLPVFVEAYKEKKSILAKGMLKVNRQAHTPHFFKASPGSTENPLSMFMKEVAKIFVQAKKIAVEITKQLHTKLKEKKALGDIEDTIEPRRFRPDRFE